MPKKLFSLFFSFVLLLLFVYLSREPRQLPREMAQKTVPISPALSENHAILSASDSSLLTGKIVKVTKVIDGDTLELEGGQKVRYIGIDTPETKHPAKGVQCFGKEAAAKNKELIEGKEAIIEKDVSETDRYGRLLRYVYIGNLFINDYLVREGYALASTYPPDVKYQDQFREAEKEARENNRGLWKSCNR